MVRERWSAVQAILDRVLDLPAAEREQALCALSDNGDVLAEVRQFLAKIDEVSSWLEEPAFTRRADAKADHDQPRLRNGDSLAGRFTIVRLLGRGGMGEVYEATDAAAVDDELGSRVALKTLRASLSNDPRAVVRFRQELFHARRVTHPNICRLYEIFLERDSEGLPILFFTMEMLQGEPLSHFVAHGALQPSESLAVIRQIAAGLDAAHAAGIVHRDIKPGNVILDRPGRDRRAVITDFGLALSQSRPGQPTGTLIGTPAYMAPEQLRGEPATASCDLYSFGILASELLFGCRPEVIPSRLPTASQRAWREAISSCTSATPSLRPRTASAFVLALESPRRGRALPRRTVAAAAVFAGGLGGVLAWIRSRSTSVPTRLAVLPVDSTHTGAEHIQSALTSQMISQFRRFPEFDVPGPAAVSRLARRALPSREIAKELEVEWLLASTIEIRDRRFVLRARLIRGDGAAGPWQGEATGSVESLESTAAGIASQAAHAIRPSLARTGAPARPRWRHAEAYDLHLQARYLFNRRQREDLLAARRLAERSVELDSEFALGYCALADILSVLGDYAHAPPIEVLPLAKQAALRAVSLAGDLADPYVSHGFATTLNDFDWHSADRSYRRALELDPNHAQAHQWYSELLAKLQRSSECILHAREAVSLDSASIPIQRNLCTMFYLVRHYQQAIEQGGMVLSMSPGFFGCREVLAECHARLGDRERSLAMVGQIAEDARTPGFSLAYVATSYAILGMVREAEDAIRRLTLLAGAFQPVHVARAFADLGRVEDCLRWLEIAYAARDTGLQLLPFHHSFDRVRAHPRIQQLLQRLRIVYPPLTRA